jgi:predicted amidohydrolase
LKIALISQKIKWQDYEYNAKRVLHFANLAKQNGVELVIFPEMCLSGFCSENRNFMQEDFVLNLIKNLPVDIVFGVGIKDNNKLYNRLYWLDTNSNIKASFDKLHAFRFGLEKDIELGNKLSNYNFNSINFGFGICYDLRFYESFGANANECEIFIVPACWPKSRVYEWKTLLKARAIENQAFFIGVNRDGVEPNLEYSNSSIVVLPNGRELKPMYKKGEMAIYDIDINEVRQRRERFNTLTDRRFELLK